MTGGKGGRFKKKVLGKLDSLYGGGGGGEFSTSNRIQNQF